MKGEIKTSSPLFKSIKLNESKVLTWKRQKETDLTFYK